MNETIKSTISEAKIRISRLDLQIRKSNDRHQRMLMGKVKATLEKEIKQLEASCVRMLGQIQKEEGNSKCL